MKYSAGQQRKNQSDAQRRVWRLLRNRNLDGHKFRRQHPIGNYTVDFVCLEKKLVVELGGGQYMAQQDYDAMRTGYLSGEGYSVLRFWNNEVFDSLDVVLHTILLELQKHPPNLSLLPMKKGQGEVNMNQNDS